MKKLLFFLFLCCLGCDDSFTVAGPRRPKELGPILPVYTDSLVTLGIKGMQGIILQRGYITINFNPEWREPFWVAEHIRPAMLAKKFKRGNDFHPDVELPDTLRVLPSDYTGSGFDRGHLAPAGDFTWNKQALRNSFLMTNMGAQQPVLNRQSWMRMEESVRSYIKETGAEAWIFTGVAVEHNAVTFSKRKIKVPKTFWKAVLYLEPNGRWTAQGFIGSNIKGEENTAAFPVFVVEHLSHFDFWPALPDSIERRIEH